MLWEVVCDCRVGVVNFIIEVGLRRGDHSLECCLERLPSVHQIPVHRSLSALSSTAQPLRLAVTIHGTSFQVLRLQNT